MDPNPPGATTDSATPDAAVLSDDPTKKNAPKNRNVITNTLIQPGLQAMGAVVQQVGALHADVQSDLGVVLGPPALEPAQRWDMFAKTSLALFNAVVVYAIADIRTLIRQHRARIVGEDHVIQQFMELPITDVNVMMIVLANVPLLQELMKKGLIDFYISAVLKYRSELAHEAEQKLEEQKHAALRDSRRRHRRSIYEALPRKAEANEDDTAAPQRIPTTLEVFDDENSSKELVYGMAVNWCERIFGPFGCLFESWRTSDFCCLLFLHRDTRNIVLSFRGSVTSRDWLMDGKVFLTSVPNPLLPTPQPGRPKAKSFIIPQSKCIGLHVGFYEYLFATKGKDETNKYTQILRNLQTIFDRAPTVRTFTLTVTGHSLGGALATIFSFYYVTEPMANVFPVTCISFASPKCGNIQFARAFQEMELEKRLFCLRVANDRDLITERPDRLTCWTFCLQNAIFRHVGIELLLYPHTSKDSEETTDAAVSNHKALYRIRYPRIRRSPFSQFSDDFLHSVFHTIRCTASVTCGCCIHDYMQWHSCDEYLNRVERAGSALQALPLQEIHESYYHIVSEESESFSFPAPLSLRKSDEPRV
jgi:Lipase (class 3)